MFNTEKIRTLEESIAVLSLNADAEYKYFETEIRRLQTENDKLRFEVENKPKYTVGKTYKLGKCIKVHVVENLNLARHHTEKFTYSYRFENDVFEMMFLNRQNIFKY